ncbi:MAG: Hsp20/alpha crystallin family protein [Bacteroidia bacterium]
MERLKSMSSEESLRKGETKSIGEIANELMAQIKENAVQKQFIPQADVWESDGAYHISVYLPGIDRADVKLDVKDGYLIISGERAMQPDVKEHKIRLLESAFGIFQRRIKLNQKADIQNIKAKLEQGILNINIPKLQEQEYIQNIKVA